MAKKEFEVGEVFQCGLAMLKCVEATDTGVLSCTGCSLKELCNECIEDLIGECKKTHREDKTDVIFVSVEE